MGNQQSLIINQSSTIHPELGPNNSGVRHASAGRSGEIIFNRNTSTSSGEDPEDPEDPMVIINRGIADQPLDVSRQKASVAIGETPSKIG